MLANLVSDPHVIIDTIEDLTDFMHSTKLNISVVTSKNVLPFTLFMLKKSDKKNFKKISKMIRTSINADRYPELIVNKIIQGKFIWINFGMILESILMANEHLGLHLSQQYFGATVGLIYSKKIDRQMKNKIDQVTYSLFESGLQRLWQRLAYRRINLRQINVDSIITLQHTRGLFVLIFLIYVILFLIFLIEIFVRK